MQFLIFSLMLQLFKFWMTIPRCTEKESRGECFLSRSCFPGLLYTLLPVHMSELEPQSHRAWYQQQRENTQPGAWRKDGLTNPTRTGQHCLTSWCELYQCKTNLVLIFKLATTCISDNKNVNAKKKKNSHCKKVPWANGHDRTGPISEALQWTLNLDIVKYKFWP